MPPLKPALALSLVALACGLSSGAAAAPATSPTLYWGAHIGDNYGLGTDAPWNPEAMVDFAAQMGKAPSLVEFGVWWAGSCAWAPCYRSGLAAFPTEQMQAIRSFGAIPVLDWASGDATQPMTSQPAFTDRAIAAGAYDAYIRRFARSARAWGHPFFLRFDWEMNGAWWPWSVSANGNTAAEYVAAWRHVRRIFSAQGVRLASWVWAVNVEPGSTTPFAAAYPGSRYVDWLGIDGYDRGGPGSSFLGLFQQTYLDLLAASTGKRIMIAEIGSTEGPGKAQFLTDSLVDIQGATAMGAYVYMDKDNGDGYQWRIDSSPSALDAFRSAIASGAYATNVYGHLAVRP